MRRFLILCLVLLCIVPFASAAPAAFSSGTNFSLANEGAGYILKNGYQIVNDTTALDICHEYGYSSVYTDYYSTYAVRNRTTGVWYGTHDGIPNPAYPRNVSIAALSVDSLTYDRIGYVAYCTSPGAVPNLYTYYPFYNSTAEAPPPVADFTGSPLNATAPAYVSFVDNSTNEYGACTYNWSFTPTDGVLAAPGDLDNEDITMLFTENGDFTISHGVSCAAGSNISTKTDYIHIYNATALSTFRVRAVDMLSGYGINGAEVDVFDAENATWVNQTSVTGEVTVTALTGHTIDAYGFATGYDDGESLALPVVAGSLYPIYMRPTDLPGNVSEGNVTAYITVLEDGTNTRLSGYSVSLTGPAAGGADFTMGVTDDNGVFTAVVKNQTNYNVKVLTQKGHLGANKNFNSGNQSGGDSYVEVTLWLGVNTITTAPTATTLPGGGTPTATLTYLPNCDPSASDYDAAKCRTSKGGMGLNILADNLEGLIWICLIVTVIYLFKGIGK